LCDRVAVIHQGELRGIGVVNDLRSRSSEKTEVIWQGAPALAAVSRLLLESHVTGDTVRATVTSSALDDLLGALRQHPAALVSVPPLHGTLEEYFLSKTSGMETVTR